MPNETSIQTWLHVSPAPNLEAIIANGLELNLGGGNYAGYETSLEGVYVSRNKHILNSHIAARDMEAKFLIVLVDIPHGAESLIDEDAIDSWLEASAREVLGNHDLSVRDAVDGEIEPDDKIWAEVAAVLEHNLGPVVTAVADQYPCLIEEFVEAWVRSDLYGEDGDGLWWPEAKNAIVRMYPNMGHPAWGENFLSRRIPGPVDIGSTAKVAGIIEVIDGKPYLAYGQIPPDALELVSELIGDSELCPNPKKALADTQTYQGLSLSPR